MKRVVFELTQEFTALCEELASAHELRRARTARGTVAQKLQ